MAEKQSLFIFDDSASLVTGQRGILRSLDNYTSVIQVLSPKDTNTLVKAVYTLVGAETEQVVQYLANKAETGADVLPSTHSLYQTVVDWNLWEAPVSSRVLQKIAKYKQGQIKVAFSFGERVVPNSAILLEGTFGLYNDLPASADTIGDYYICDSYNYTSAVSGLTFTKNDVAVWNGTAWTKPTQFKLLANSSTIDITVSSSMHAVNPTTLTSDEEFELDFAQMQSDVNSHETDLIDLAAGNFVQKAIKYDVDNPKTTIAIGESRWNDTEKTFETRLSNDVILQHGLEDLLRARNSTGANIANMKVVRISGAVGQNPTVVLYSNTDTSNDPIGVTTEELVNNEVGFVARGGRVFGDTSAWTEGTKLYAGLNGELTSTIPTFPAKVVCIGYVLYQHASLGKIGLNITPEDYTKMNRDLINQNLAVDYVPTANNHIANKGYIDTKEIIGIDLADNIELAEFKTALGEATTSLAGLMSATDKTRLDTLYALLDDSDADTVVDTIQEVLNIFENYPEGTDIVTALAGKVDKVTGKSLVDDLEIAKLEALDTQAQLNTKFNNKVDVDVSAFPELLASSSAGDELVYVYDSGSAEKLKMTLNEIYTGANAASGAFVPAGDYAGDGLGAYESAMLDVHELTYVINGDFKINLKTQEDHKLMFVRFSTITDTSNLRISTDDGVNYYNVIKNGSTFKASLVSGQLVRLEFNGSEFIADIQGNVEIEETYTDRIESTYGEFNPLDKGLPLIKEIQGRTIPALDNLVTNGDFETDTTGWTALNIGTPSVSGGIVSFTATANGGYLRQVLSPAVNDILYLIVRLKTNSASVGMLIAGGLNGLHTGSGNYEIIRKGFTALATSVSYGVIDTRSSGWTQTDLDYAMAFNLTASHGVTATSGTAYDNAVADIEAQLEANGGYIDTTATTHVLNSEFKATGKNLFDKSAVTLGQYVDRNTGLLGGVTGYMASDYISIIGGQQYFQNHATTSSLAGVAFYDVNKNYISGVSTQFIANIPYTAPINARYLRTSLNGNVSGFNIDNIQLEQGTVATTYAPYNSETQLFNHTALRSTIDKTVYDKIRYDNGAYVKDVYINSADNTALATPLLATEVIDVDGTLIQESVTTVEQLQNIPTTYKLEYAMNTEQTTKTLVERDRIQQEEIDTLETHQASYALDSVLAVNDSFTISGLTCTWIHVKMKDGNNATGTMIEKAFLSDGEVLTLTIAVSPEVTGTLTNSGGTVTFTSSSASATCRVNNVYWKDNNPT